MSSVQLVPSEQAAPLWQQSERGPWLHLWRARLQESTEHGFAVVQSASVTQQFAMTSFVHVPGEPGVRSQRSSVQNTPSSQSGSLVQALPPPARVAALFGSSERQPRIRSVMPSQRVPIPASYARSGDAVDLGEVRGLAGADG